MATNGTVSVAGIQKDGMGGLKESIGAFRKHHQEVGDALLNISGIGTATGDSVDKDEPRPEYKHQNFPRMLYHASRGERMVDDAEEQRIAIEEGYRKDHYLKPQVAVNDPQVEKKELLDRNRELGGQVTILSEVIEKLEARLTAMEKGKK